MINVKDKIILLIAYIFFLIIILITNIRKIRKDKKLSAIIFVNAYYFIIFVITPICVLLKNEEIPYFIYSNNAKYYYLSLISAFIGYICLNVGYKIKIDNNLENKKSVHNSKNLILSGYIVLLIGWCSLIVWTKAFGSITGIFKYASLIRSGHGTIYNKYTFVKPFCPMTIFAFEIFYSMMLNFKTFNVTKKILVTIGLVFSLIGSYLYIIANDGRMLILIFFLVIIMSYIENKSETVNLKKIIIYLIIAIVMIIVLGQLDNVTYYIRNGQRRQEENNNNIITIIANEFGYTYSNNININYLKDEGTVEGYTIIRDIKNLLWAWIPQRMKPDDATNLFEYNTTFYRNTTGQIPSDLITAAIYKFGYIGVVLLPLLVGMFFKILERKLFEKRNKSTYYLVISYLIIIYLGLRFIGYYDLSQILFGSFYIIISMIIVEVISKIKINKNDKLYRKVNEYEEDN